MLTTTGLELPDSVARKWRNRWAREAECGNCGRTLRVHVPKHGDGTELVTYFHKPPGENDRRWCRSFIDPNDARDIDTWRLAEHGLPEHGRVAFDRANTIDGYRPVGPRTGWICGAPFPSDGVLAVWVETDLLGSYAVRLADVTERTTPS